MIEHSRPTVKKEHLEKALLQMISDKLFTGEAVYEFERAFASLFGRAYSALFVTSGTAALTLIFQRMGIKEGDEALLPSFYNSSPLQVINRFGAKPVFVDIASDSFNLDMDILLSKITEKTKLILVPHMYGNAALVDELANANVPIVEDCGHSLGATFKNAHLGTLGDYAYFSFAATRMISSGGAGGMILTKKKGVVDALRDMRYYDKKDDLAPRYNYMPTDIQAAIGLAELKKLDWALKLRKEIAAIYDAAVMPSEAYKTETHDNETPNHYRYVVKLGGKMSVKETIELFAKNDVEVARAIYKPLHWYYENEDREQYPQTEDAYMRSVSIPIYPTLLKKDVERIAKILSRIR